MSLICHTQVKRAVNDDHKYFILFHLSNKEVLTFWKAHHSPTTKEVWLMAHNLKESHQINLISVMRIDEYSFIFRTVVKDLQLGVLLLMRRRTAKPSLFVLFSCSNDWMTWIWENISLCRRQYKACLFTSNKCCLHKNSSQRTHLRGRKQTGSGRRWLMANKQLWEPQMCTFVLEVYSIFHYFCVLEKKVNPNKRSNCCFMATFCLRLINESEQTGSDGNAK